MLLRVGRLIAMPRLASAWFAGSVAGMPVVPRLRCDAVRATKSVGSECEALIVCFWAGAETSAAGAERLESAEAELKPEA